MKNEAEDDEEEEKKAIEKEKKAAHGFSKADKDESDSIDVWKDDAENAFRLQLGSFRPTCLDS